MKNIEEILNMVITELRAGKPLHVSMLTVPEEYREEIIKLLPTVQLVKSLPKRVIPSPVKQRKYLSMEFKRKAWFTWLHISRFTAVSTAALLLIAGFATTAYGAIQSLPGQALFPLKKTAERVQLHFASNDIERANLQLKITQERLADAQTVFSSPDTSSQQKLAALTELTHQTDATLQTVKSATNAGSQSGSPLVATLQDISHQQENLLNKIDAQQKVAAADPTSAAVKQFRQMVVATNEQASVIALAPDPNATVVVGSVTNFGFGIITIDKTGIVFSSSTVFKLNGSVASASAATVLNKRAVVIADKSLSSTELTAREVLLTSDDSSDVSSPPPLVKGASTSTPAQSASEGIIASTTPEKIENSPHSTSTDNIDSNIPVDSQSDLSPDAGKAVGTFIPEDPAPQFHP